jgi:hypothetical protein
VLVCHTIVYSEKCILKTTMIYECILILQFVRCIFLWLSYDAVSFRDCIASLVGQVVRKWFGRKWSWSKQGSILAFAWKDWGNPWKPQGYLVPQQDWVSSTSNNKLLIMSGHNKTVCTNTVDSLYIAKTYSLLHKAFRKYSFTVCAYLLLDLAVTFTLCVLLHSNIFLPFVVQFGPTFIPCLYNLSKCITCTVLCTLSWDSMVGTD